MPPNKEVIGISEDELRTVYNAHEFDSYGFTAALARSFTAEQLEKAYAYASYCKRNHEGSSLWSNHTINLWDAADLARQQQTNPHAIDEWLAEWGRAEKAQHVDERLKQFGLAFLVTLVFLGVLGWHHTAWPIRLPAALTSFTVTMAVLRTYTWDEITGGVVLLIVAFPVIFFFVLML